jgi:serine protease Do
VRDPFSSFFGEERQGEGSGFIINGKERLAITNNHVVEGAQRIFVTLSDKRTLRATVVGTDPIGDIALIRIDGNGDLPEEVKFADSDRLEIGQIVVAIGNPLGLENTVTQGVLSGSGRKLEGRVERIPLEDLIQTDAAINPGNSGGPLLDGYGRVIGMNTAIVSRAQGIGFAVAANTIKRATTDILKYGRVIRPWVGVSMQDLTPAAARNAGILRRDLDGVIIASVRNGDPADKAGLRRGDVITDAGGHRVTSVEELRRQIRVRRPGDKLPLKGLRSEQSQSWVVTLGEMPPVEQLGE